MPYYTSYCTVSYTNNSTSNNDFGWQEVSSWSHEHKLSKKLKKKDPVDFDQIYKDIEDEDIIKLLKSISDDGLSFSEKTFVPLVMLNSVDSHRPLSVIEILALRKKHAAISDIASVKVSDIFTSSSELDRHISFNFYADRHNTISPIVVMMGLPSKDQSITDQSMMLNLGQNICDNILTFIRDSSNEERYVDPGSVTVRSNPLFIISESLDIDALENAATLVGVSEIEEVKEDYLSYIKLTF